MKVLVVGGYGVFGGRLARLLADEPRLSLLLAGRSQDKARAFCESIETRSTLVPWRFDRDGDLDLQLTVAAPDLVVDASGPFQAYGERPWRLAQACIAAGIPTRASPRSRPRSCRTISSVMRAQWAQRCRHATSSPTRRSCRS